MHGDAVQSDSDGDGRAATEEHGRRHSRAPRSGTPAMSSPSVTATVTIMASSMARMSGLAHATG